jgi:hypothetical protein
MKRNDATQCTLRRLQTVKLRDVSEPDARRKLRYMYDNLRRRRDTANQSLQRRYGQEAEYGAVRSYFKGDRIIGCPMFDLVDSRFWEDYVVFIGDQIRSSEKGEQTFCYSRLRVSQFLGRSVFDSFFKYLFLPQLNFISHDPRVIRQYPVGAEITYSMLVGFTAAHIAVKPELYRALQQARPELASCEALSRSAKVLSQPLVIPGILWYEV